jgi:hypothetical protein
VICAPQRESRLSANASELPLQLLVLVRALPRISLKGCVLRNPPNSVIAICLLRSPLSGLVVVVPSA